MINDSIKLAQFWIELRNMKDKLDNEILPISGHLGVNDSKLLIAMEQLSKSIGAYFNEFKLATETQKNEQQKTANS